jgi:hypothetical protein
MNKRNNKGPKTDPWGTPDVTLWSCEQELPGKKTLKNDSEKLCFVRQKWG